MPKRLKQRRTAELLNGVADALNACRDAGLNLRIKHGALQCEEGLVLDLPDGSWAARTRAYTPFASAADDTEDDL